MWVGLKVVPILLLANMFLGIYYNLSIWYKLGNKTIAGAYITLIGACLTILINYIFIPYYSYVACAWATFTCYGVMMVISYIWGQKNYRIPYATKKLCAYIIIAVLFYGVHYYTLSYWAFKWLNYTLATLLFVGYLIFVLNVERKEVAQIPFMRRVLKKASN